MHLLPFAFNLSPHPFAFRLSASSSRFQRPLDIIKAGFYAGVSVLGHIMLYEEVLHTRRFLILKNPFKINYASANGFGLGAGCCVQVFNMP